jgi:hypothetical protein
MGALRVLKMHPFGRKSISKALRFLALVFLSSVGEQMVGGMLAQPVQACTDGQLDYVKVGDTAAEMFATPGGNRRIITGCGGPFEVRYLAEGKFVFCQKRQRDEMAKRLLVVNGVVVDIRSGVGNTSMCSWDGN